MAARNDIVPLDAMLLRKLAAIVSGWPEPREYYMVVSSDGTNTQVVLDATGVPELLDEVQATNRARTLRTKPGVVAVQVLGPFVSPGDPGAYGVEVSTVESVGAYKPGRWRVPPGTDLLCWTPSAFDKFVAPYYYLLYGSNTKASAEVDALRQQMASSDSGIMGHRWPTSPEYLENAFGFLKEPG